MLRPKLHADEELLQVYRKHKIALLPKASKVIFLWLLVLYFGLGYHLIFTNFLVTYLFIALTAGVLGYLGHLYTIWNLNVYFLTSKRLVHIVHSNVFKKIETETPIARILNVSFRTTGMLSSTFNYGDVYIQIVGVAEPLILKKIPYPEDVKDFVWKAHLQYGGDQRLTFTQPEIAPVH